MRAAAHQYARPMSQSGPAAPTTEEPPAKGKKLWPWYVAGGIFALIIAAAIVIPVSIAQRDADEKAAAQVAAEEQAAAAEKARLAQFSTALKSCDIRAKNVVIHDSGESIELTRVTKYDGMTYSELTCFLAGLDAPESIDAKLSQTRALDGRQVDDWDGFEIAWSYHPDSGASIIIEHAD